MHPDGLRQVKALIRFYFRETVEDEKGNVNVNKLITLWSELQFALQFDGKLSIKEPIKG